MIFVTGGCGFIGSNFILDWLKSGNEPILNIDSLTYASNVKNLATLTSDRRYIFARCDINDSDHITELLIRHKPRAVINFAAESHVDRSITGPIDFINTNIVGTFRLLEAVRAYFFDLDLNAKNKFRFFHISTDEVYGTLASGDDKFRETSQYRPNSPYSASKASSDHLVRAYFKTFGLPVLTTNCSNNYGPYQFTEKLIPLCVKNALLGKELPLYGDGLQIRDWLYVEDHCAAIRLVLDQGIVGDVYNVGGVNEMSNLAVVKQICSILDDLRPRENSRLYAEQIKFVKDRLGHDRRYAVDISKIDRELGWKPKESFNSGLLKTVAWYVENHQWLD